MINTGAWNSHRIFVKCKPSSWLFDVCLQWKPITLISYVPKRNKVVLLLSSKHHNNEVDSKDGKPIIVLEYNKIKGAVDTVDYMCYKYFVRRGTKRWSLCVFYAMVDITDIDALIVWKEKNPDWNKNERYKRRLFLEESGTSLTAHLLDFRSKNSKLLHKDIQNALALMGYSMIDQTS
jgi:hypothetical protein